MKHQLRALLLIVLILSIGSLACGLFGGSSNEGDEAPAATATAAPEEPAKTEEPAQEPTATTEPTATPEPAPDADGGAESVDLDNPDLFKEPENADTYKISMEYTFDATSDDGSAITGAVFLDGAHRVDPLETRLTFDTEGEAVFGDAQDFTFILIGDTQYINSTETGCFSGPAVGPENPFTIFLDSGGLLTGSAQRLLPDEEVNGIDAYVYEITEINLDPSDLDASDITTIEEGRIYIAKDGGFVTRLEFRGTAVVDVLSNTSQDGDVYYQLNIYSVNEPVDITKPEECEGFEDTSDSDFPILPDAAEMTTFAGLSTYYTEASVSEAVEFYETEMAAAGWTYDESLSLVSGDGGFMSFSNSSGEEVLVTLTVDGGRTIVTIVESP